MMKAKNKNIASILLAVLFLNACQTNVRFSSERYAEPQSRNEIPKVSKTCNSFSHVKSSVNKKPDSAFAIQAYPAEYDKSIVIKEAVKWIGVPYRWGGSDSAGTDCSGFVQSVYKAFGLRLPRTAADQFDFSEIISEEEAVPGDLIFFKIEDRIVHVGLYAGNNKMVHASTKTGVVIQELSRYSYYSKKVNIAGFVRVAAN